MSTEDKKVEPPKKEYLQKAKDLSKKDAERLMSRMRRRFIRRLHDDKLSKTEALALQLAYEDEQLAEWRKNLAKVREKFKD